MKDRNLSIDLLRGVAIFIIIWAHVSLGWMLDEIVNVTVLGLFYCISGFFYRQQSLLDITKKKAVTLLKPWLIFTLIGYAYHMFMTQIVDHTSFRWDMIMVDLVRGCDFEANIPCWFFISLFEILVLYTILQRFGLRPRTLICMAFFVVGEMLLSHDINYFYLGKTSLYLLFLHTGFMIKSYWDNIRSRIQFDMIFNIVAIITVFVLFYAKILNVSNQYLDWIIGYVACVLIFIPILLFNEKLLKLSTNIIIRFISFVGRNSLTVFALHILTNDIVWRVLYPYFHTPDFAESFLYACISLILCMPAIYVYNWAFGDKRRYSSIKTI